LKWEKFKYDNNSSFNGSLRYLAGAALQDGRILLCGGCLISTGDATNTVYESNVLKPFKITRKKSLNVRRYAHQCVALNGYVYAIGGFDNKDADGIAPNTLDSCERYSFHDNKWYNCCAMNEPRAFAGACTMSDQFIYLFGGFHDYEVLASIEKFDSVLDNWLTLYVKLPVPLAKLGVCSVD
jgi:hypothetical protein